MKKFNCAVAITMAAVLAFAGCGKKTATPTVSANVPVVSETPAIETPNVSALVSPTPSTVVTPEPSPVTSAATT